MKPIAMNFLSNLERGILDPQEKMKPNSRCWCLSGKKWKVCHRDRHSERVRSFSEVWSNYQRTSIQTYCSHPGAPAGCGAKIIQSHTVQRNGGLAAVAEGGHVFSTMSGVKNLGRNSGKLLPEKIGTKSASTFPGYCDEHDGELFSPVEVGTIALGREAAFLLSLRAGALERFRKYQMVEGFRQEARLVVDCGKPFPEQAQLQEAVAQIISSSGEGLRDAEHNRALYDAAFGDPSRGSFGFYFVEFVDMAPLVSCGAFAPLTSITGTHLQSLVQGEPVDMIAANFTVLNGRSALVLGWMKNNGPAELFARSFAALQADDKAEVACLIAFRCIENTFWRPSWWVGLDQSQRDLILSETERMADSFNVGADDETRLNVFQSSIQSEKASFPL